MLASLELEDYPILFAVTFYSSQFQNVDIYLFVVIFSLQLDIFIFIIILNITIELLSISFLPYILLRQRIPSMLHCVKLPETAKYNIVT
jgi:hypothetical protein